MHEKDDITFKYMSRFGCIGPACEEHCCGGWRIDVDASHAAMLRVAAGNAGSDRERIRNAFAKKEVAAGKKKPKQSPKGTPEHKVLKMKADGNCVLLDEDRRCHVHATLGSDLLPDVCATYPRRVIQIDKRKELSASLSCPEVARQVLLHEDALEEIPLEPGMIPRRMISARVDTRDIRPSLRMMPDVRAFALRRLSDTSRPFAHRLFALTLFAHRTQTSLATAALKGDFEAVRAEIVRLDDVAVLDEIGRRFDAIETPALPVLLVARELVRQDSIGTRQVSFRSLVAGVFDTYAKLDLAEHRQSGSGDKAMSAAIQAAYTSRRARALGLAGPLIESRLRNFIFHAWTHHLPTSSPDMMVFVLRIWLHLATIRFLFFSHPRLHAWFNEHPADGPQDAAAFEALVDLLIVEVVRTTGRYIDHSGLIGTLEKMLGDRQMRNLGGAVHLIKF